MRLQRIALPAIFMLTVALSTTKVSRAELPCPRGFPSGPRFETPKCSELILRELPGIDGLPSVGTMVFGPDGSLYFTRPAMHQVARLRPNGTGFSTTPEVFADQLPEWPNGLAFDAQENAFFVSMDTLILRVPADKPAADKTIVSGLPGGVGGWLGNIRIGPDRRLYVAKGASCDACIETDNRRAALLSFALDGTDPRIVARGLRDSFDFGWNPADGTLYIVDNERPTLRAELNAISQADLRAGKVPDFGWSRCDFQGQPVPGVPGATADYCAATTRPVLTFDPDSHPTAVLFYQGAGFPDLKGSLLVALAGSWNQSTITGYEIRQVKFDAKNTVTGSRRWIPEADRNTADSTLIRISFYPYRVSSMLVDSSGWVYVASLQGRIYRFRPEVP